MFEALIPIGKDEMSLPYNTRRIPRRILCSLSGGFETSRLDGASKTIRG